jgi:hypothetical protein
MVQLSLIPDSLYDTYPGVFVRNVFVNEHTEKSNEEFDEYIKNLILTHDFNRYDYNEKDKIIAHIFNSGEKCYVCLEYTNHKVKFCNHSICQKCFCKTLNNLEKFKCGICRTTIYHDYDIQGDDEEEGWTNVGDDDDE